LAQEVIWTSIISVPKLMTARGHLHTYGLFMFANHIAALKKCILIEADYHIIILNVQKHYCSAADLLPCRGSNTKIYSTDNILLRSTIRTCEQGGCIQWTKRVAA
jgi:hypothetical protein